MTDGAESTNTAPRVLPAPDAAQNADPDPRSKALLLVSNDENQMDIVDIKSQSNARSATSSAAENVLAAGSHQNVQIFDKQQLPSSLISSEK